MATPTPRRRQRGQLSRCRAPACGADREYAAESINKLPRSDISLGDADAPKSAGSPTGVPRVRAMYCPRPDAREQPFAFLVTGVTMGCGDERPTLYIVLARNRGPRTCSHRNCKNSLPSSTAATSERSKRCFERRIRSCVGLSTSLARRSVRRAVDTADILQSLFRDFLRQLAAGEPAETSKAPFPGGLLGVT